jgi:integrase/recombinase XerD
MGLNNKCQSNFKPEKKIDLLPLPENVQIVKLFLNYMNDNGSSINHIINSLKSIISFGIYTGPQSFYEIKYKEDIFAFLNTKIKSIDFDPDKKWVTTWNFYLNRLKIFYRWLYNHQKSYNYEDHETKWQTPSFIGIKNKQTKRLIPIQKQKFGIKKNFCL